MPGTSGNWSVGTQQMYVANQSFFVNNSGILGTPDAFAQAGVTTVPANGLLKEVAEASFSPVAIAEYNNPTLVATQTGGTIATNQYYTPAFPAFVNIGGTEIFLRPGVTYARTGNTLMQNTPATSWVPFVSVTYP